MEFIETRQASNLPRIRTLDFDHAHAREGVDFTDLGRGALASGTHAGDRIADGNRAPGDLADTNASDVIAPVKVAHQHFEGPIRIHGRCRNMFDHGFE